MPQPPLKDRPQLVTEFIRRVVTYTDKLTYFGENSVNLAIAKASAAAASNTNRLYRAALRRFTLLGATDEFLDSIIEERGAPRNGAVRSRVLLILQPHTTTITAIAAADLTVADSSQFEAGDSVRVRNADGTETEIATVSSVPDATSVILSGSLSGTYTPGSEETVLLLRKTIAESTQFTGDHGLTFATVASVDVGDDNPVMAGEGTSLALSDKVWAECTTPGAAGNVDRDTINAFVVDEPDISSVFNPEAARGGSDQESDADARYRAAHLATLANQETQAAFEALAKTANSEVLRAWSTTSTGVGQIQGYVLRSSGGTFGSVALSVMESYIESRIRSGLQVELINVSLTSVEVSATITLDANVSLETAWRRVANALADVLDHRTRTRGEDVTQVVLLNAVKTTIGIATVDEQGFLPAADVVVGDDSLPTLTVLALEDSTSGDTINAALTMSF